MAEISVVMSVYKESLENFCVAVDSILNQDFEDYDFIIINDNPGEEKYRKYIDGLKNEKIRDLIDGKPTVIIKNGKLNFKEMSHLRYSLDDLVTQLRLQGVKSIEKVKYAILENNGSLSVFSDDEDYPLPLILDGVIDYKVLSDINKDYPWLKNIISKKQIELEGVFYAFYTHNKLFIITKDELL